MPHFVGNDEQGMIARATIAQDGALTEAYTYLSNYVKG